MSDDTSVEIAEMGPLSLKDWLELTGRSPAPFGETSAGLTYRPKERHVVARDADGRLAGAVGTTIATVSVNGEEPFDVIGLGALIVRKDMRSHGVYELLVDRLRQILPEIGPDWAMLFCEARLMPLYAMRGYLEIEDPVWVDQPEGRIRMPLSAMWRARGPVEWPRGEVQVHGYPF